jgi:HK97 family phage portal protein
MLLDSLLGWSSATVKRSSAPISQSLWTSNTGEIVSQEGALNLSSVWCAVILLSNAMKVAPLQLYRRTAGEGKELAGDHPLYHLVHRRPNPECTPGMFKWYLQMCKLLWGNGYAEIIRDGAGRPVELWPIHPTRVSVARIDYGEGERPALGWKVTEELGHERTVDDTDMFHVVGFSADGYTGQSVLGYARHSLGIGMATQNYGASFFKNGARPSLVLKHPTHFKDQEARARFREQWRTAYSGNNAYSAAVLEEGLDITTLGMPNDDAQFLETRTFEVVEIARWFNIPPSKLKDLGRATWANIEHLQIEYVTDGVVPHYLDFEEQCDAKLLTEEEGATYFFEFNADGLLRGDIKTRYEAYKTAIGATFMRPNEARRRENLNPVEGGDELFMPVNMTTLTKFNKPPKAEPVPPPGAEVAEQPEMDEEDKTDKTDDQFGRMRNVAHQLFEDAWNRVLRKESKALRAALKKHYERGNGEAFAAWLNEWYPLFQRETTEILTSPLRVIASLENRTDDWAAGRAMQLAQDHVCTSRGQVAGLLKSGGAIAVCERIDDWLKTRANVEAGKSCE